MVREACPIFQLPRILFGFESAEDGWMKIRVTSPLKIWNLLLMTPFPQETLIQEIIRSKLYIFAPVGIEILKWSFV